MRKPKPTRKPRLRIHRERRAAPGAPPGLLLTDPKAAPGVVFATCYRPDQILEKRIDDSAELAGLAEQWPVCWVHVEGLGDAPTLENVGTVFGLHPLALEDVVNPNQRCKVEPYDRYLFMVVQSIWGDTHPRTDQLSMFLGRNFLVTFVERGRGGVLEAVRQRLRADNGRMRRLGPDYLAYSVLDAVVDHYFPVLETYGERLEELDNEVVWRPTPAAIAAIHDVRQDLMALRRTIWPLRDALNDLIREATDLITDEARLFLRDCHDHTVRVLEFVESDRELASSLMEVYLTSVSNRMNDVIKTLTIISTIFIPMSFIASVYGMNFNSTISRWNMPELNWPMGYPLALGMMGVVAGSMLQYFWRKGWIGASRKRPPAPVVEPSPE
jgi:magnesium transporter